MRRTITQSSCLPVPGTDVMQLTVGRLDGRPATFTWLQICFPQQYCFKQAEHKWGEKAHKFSCAKNTACTCTGPSCDKSALEVSTEMNTKLPDNADTRTGCQWGDTVLLSVTSFDYEINHEINVHAKPGI